MPVTIVVPRGAEERAIRRAAPLAAIVPIAAGAAAAASAAAIEAGAVVVVVGLCGALTGACVGDVVCYERIAGDEGAQLLDPTALATMRGAFPKARLVTACTAQRVVTRVVERAAFAARYAADVVDMEAMPLALALRARALRYAMVRVVSDDAGADLPPIDDALDPDGTLRPLALAAAFGRAPVAAVRFVRDVQASLRVLGTVGSTLAALK